jgi:hypothetical protein
MSKILHFLISCFVILSFLFLLINLSETKSFAQSWKKYPNLKTGSKIEFPRDEGFHPEEAMEWWYANGHFTGHTINTVLCLPIFTNLFLSSMVSES